MRIFEDIKIEWDGDEYVVPSNRVMGAIARVEEFVTLKELSEFSQKPEGAKYAKLSQAYGTLLRYAGAKVEDEEVYEAMFPKNSADEDFRARLYAALGGLLKTMLPPRSLSTVEEGAVVTEGKQQPIAAKSFQKPTEQRSEPVTGTGDSVPTSSGGSIPKSSGGSRKRNTESLSN